MTLTMQQRTQLESVLSVGYDGSVSARAQIVLWWDEGTSAADIAIRAGTTKPTVYKWVDRYEQGGLAALEDQKSTGRPPSVSGQVRSRIIALTKVPPPGWTGLTHWSSYEMSRYLKRHEGIAVSHNFIAQLWREHGLKPHRQGTFKVSRDPDFSMKVADIVGLYLDPPTGAVVLSIDEKTQVQALQRTQPLLPLAFGKTEKRTHDYVRHGTTNLFAALDTLTGKVIARCLPRKRTGEFLKFMNQVVKSTPTDSRSTSSSTTCPPTTTTTSPAGYAGTRRCTSTSHPKVVRGSTRSRPGSESSPARRSGAVPSGPSLNSSRESTPTSPTGMRTRRRSSGRPPPPTRSLPRSPSSIATTGN